MVLQFHVKTQERKMKVRKNGSALLMQYLSHSSHPTLNVYTHTLNTHMYKTDVLQLCVSNILILMESILLVIRRFK